MKHFLTAFLLMPSLVCAAAAQNLEAIRGDWNGRIAGRLPIIFHLGDKVTLDSPDQNAFGMPANLNISDGKVVISIGAAGPRFEGELSANGQSLSGLFHQAGQSIPLVLSRGSKVPPAPITPSPDILDANERAVRIENDGLSLHGTLREPPGAAPGPAVLIIAGSGPTDRNGNQPDGVITSATYRQLAVALDKSGIRTLRFDKRMIGMSTGPKPIAESDLRFSHYVNDAAAWARYLALQPGVTCVVILGHSEGALIASMSARKLRTCGVISAAGVGRPFGDLLRTQLANGGIAPTALAQAQAVITELEAGRPVPGIPQANTLFRPSVQPYLISQFSIFPAAELANVIVPVLILQGDNDIQVTEEDSRLLAKAKPDATHVVVAGMNHGLRISPRDREGNLATYGDPSLPLAPEGVDAIVWFVRNAKQVDQVSDESLKSFPVDPSQS
jgi:pimeloyl-ACP methyl ester carboxylesterase